MCSGLFVLYSLSGPLGFGVTLAAGFRRGLGLVSSFLSPAVVGLSSAGFLRGRPRRAGFFLGSASEGLASADVFSGTASALVASAALAVISPSAFFVAGLRVRRRFGFSTAFSSVAVDSSAVADGVIGWSTGSDPVVLLAAGERRLRGAFGLAFSAGASAATSFAESAFGVSAGGFCNLCRCFRRGRFFGRGRLACATTGFGFVRFLLGFNCRCWFAGCGLLSYNRFYLTRFRLGLNR